MAVAFLPDADVLGFSLGIPYEAPWGHRGASHSLVFAMGIGMLGVVAAAFLRLPAVRIGAVIALACASHALLDMLTDGGMGIALFWPFSDERLFAPWRPIPVAPLGRRIVSEHGLKLMAWEAGLFLPVFVASLWPRRTAAEDRG